VERLSALDSSFLHVEDGVTHMHIASCAVFEGPPPQYEEVVGLLSAKLPRLPRYRQRVRSTPGEVGRPVWIDDPSFDVTDHVRQVTLPQLHRDDELENLMAGLMGVELPRDRPLWEMWMVDGLSMGRWALISKVHHCMVDGVAGTDLMISLLDVERAPAEPPAASPWTPGVQPTSLHLTLGALFDLLHLSAAQLRALAGVIRMPREALGAIVDAVQGSAVLGRELLPAGGLSIEGSIGPHRRWAVGRVELADVKAIGRELGGTVNDVVLTAVSSAFRDLLIARGECVDGVTLRSLVPVSLRAADDHTANNQVGAMIVELAIDVADPVQRFELMRQRMEDAKASHQEEATAALNVLVAHTPPMLEAIGLHASSFAQRVVPQRSVHTVTTNVPGPQFPLFALGRELLEYLPFVPLAQGVRIGIAVTSYNGQVRFGVTGDYETVPEVAWFCGRIESAVAELLERTCSSEVTIAAPG
jgi:diacylglycerol O-acyltransferase